MRYQIHVRGYEVIIIKSGYLANVFTADITSKQAYYNKNIEIIALIVEYYVNYYNRYLLYASNGR